MSQDQIGVPPAGVQAIVNVSIVDLVGGWTRKEQTVIWDRSRIVAAGPSSEIPIPPGARTISGRGRFLMPGLWDMHVHLAPHFGAENITLPLLLAFGVTAVREMAEDPDPAQPFRTHTGAKHAWSNEAIAGLRIGPRIMAVGSFHIDGPGVVSGEIPAFFGAATPGEARKLVRYIKDETEADFIKIYSLIPRDSFFALVDEAHRWNLDACGHKPLTVSFIEAADAGMRSMEHAREILLDSFSGAAALQRNPSSRNLSPARLQEVLDQHDPDMLLAIFSALKRNGSYYCPTHTTRKFDASVHLREYLSDRRLKWVQPAVKSEWMQDAALTQAKAPTAADREAYARFYRKGRQVTAAAHAAGVKILAGTDAGDSFCFHGSSLHDELADLVEAGLTPLDALRSATLTPAEYFGRRSDFGEIATGKIADFVLLGGNPLRDIRQTLNIEGVGFNGHYYDRSTLDALLAQLESLANPPN